MQRICVFCGSSPGINPVFADAARELGRTLADAGIGLVFGGGSVGLMGIIANAVLDCGGQVTGIIPRLLVERELALTRLDDLRIVESMHERKALMAKLADGFIALPGGFGTLEEFIEVLTWAQLGIHAKPCGLLNTDGYYGHLLRFIDHMVATGFAPPESREMIQVAQNSPTLLEEMRHFRASGHDKTNWALKLSNT